MSHVLFLLGSYLQCAAQLEPYPAPAICDFHHTDTEVRVCFQSNHQPPFYQNNVHYVTFHPKSEKNLHCLQYQTSASVMFVK